MIIAIKLFSIGCWVETLKYWTLLHYDVDLERPFLIESTSAANKKPVQTDVPAVVGVHRGNVSDLKSN